MKLSKISALTLVAATACFAATSVSAWTYKDETTSVTHTSVPFSIERDGGTNTGVIHYNFKVSVKADQTGSKVSLTHPRDSRSCEIEVTTEVQRNVCFTNIFGNNDCTTQYTGKLPKSDFYKPVKRNFLDGDPCSDFTEKMRSMKNNAVDEIVKQSGPITNADMKQIANEWNGAGYTVTYRPE